MVRYQLSMLVAMCKWSCGSGDKKYLICHVSSPNVNVCKYTELTFPDIKCVQLCPINNKTCRGS